MTVHECASRIATWPILALLFIVYLLCTQGFSMRQECLGHANKTLDSRFWYTPGDVKKLMDDLMQPGRNCYAISEVTLDLLFPFVYGSLLAIFIVKLYDADVARWLVLVPLAAMIFDLCENFTIAYLALTHDSLDGERSLAYFAAVCTALKTILILTCMFVIIGGGAIYRLFRPMHVP